MTATWGVVLVCVLIGGFILGLAYSTARTGDGILDVTVEDEDVTLSGLQINVDVDELITKDHITIKLVKHIDENKIE